MHVRIKPMATICAITVAWLMATSAQSAPPSFFGASSNAANAVPAATPARPSPSQVWSNDDFAKKAGALKSQNDAQYQQNFNAKLKPMPSETSSSKVVLPTPAGSSPAPSASPAPAPAPAATTTAPAATTNSTYTGFVNPNNSSNTNTTTPAKSSGWGVTY